MVNTSGLHHWPECYLADDATKIYQQEDDDLFLADIPMPSKPCQLNATIAGHNALITITPNNGVLSGMIVLHSDDYGLEHIAQAVDYKQYESLPATKPAQYEALPIGTYRYKCQNGLTPADMP